MRVGHTEYTIDRDTADLVTRSKHKSFAGEKQWEWDSSPAPWLQGASKGILTNKNGLSSLLDALRITWHCHCTDFRDKVFGILGIAKEEAWSPQTDSVSIEPNYALSAQQVFIGAFAHCLVVDRDPRVIMSASGIEGWTDYPSWVPAWKSTAPLIPIEVDLGSQKYVYWTREWQGTILKRCKRQALELNSSSVQTYVVDGDMRFVQGLFQSAFKDFKVQQHHVCPDCKVKNEKFGPLQDGCYKCRSQFTKMRFLRIGEHTGGLRPLRDQEKLSVQQSTGALSIQLTHLFRINMQPSLIGRMKNMEVFCYHLSGRPRALASTPDQDTIDPDEHQIFFTSKTKGLDQLICPEKDSLFAMVEGDQRLVFFILRPTDTPGRFRIVTRCLEVLVLDYDNPPSDTHHADFRSSAAHRQEQHTLKISAIQHSLKAVLRGDAWETRLEYHNHRMICRAFLVLCDQVQIRDIVATARHAWDSDQVLWEHYLSCMKPHEPRVYHGPDGQEMVEMRIYYHATEYSDSHRDSLAVGGTYGTNTITEHRDRYVRLMESLGVIAPVGERKRNLVDILSDHDKPPPWAWDEALVRIIDKLDGSWGRFVGSELGKYSWGSVKIMSTARQGRHFVLRAYKSELLKLLRESLQRVDLLRGRLSWGDKVWCEANSADEGGDRAGPLAWPDLMLNSTLLKVPENKDAFIFDGTSYQVEIV